MSKDLGSWAETRDGASATAVSRPRIIERRLDLSNKRQSTGTKVTATIMLAAKAKVFVQASGANSR